MNKKILLIGGGGHCKSIIDSLVQTKQYSEIGIIDRADVDSHILGIPIIGSDDDLSRLHKEGYEYAFVTVGSTGNPALRIKLFEVLEGIGFRIPNIIDATATLSKHMQIDNGIFIGKNVVINIGSSIGKGAIINTNAVIEHDCTIGAFVHVAPGTVLCGEVQIGINTHIGAGSVIKQQIKIGANTVIGMGSVVIKDIKNDMLAYGNPCKEVKELCRSI